MFNDDRLYRKVSVELENIKAKTGDQITIEDIDRELQKAFNDWGITSQELKGKDARILAIKRRLLANFPIFVDPGVMLATENNNWFSERTTIEHIYWDRYENFLINDQKLPESVVSTMKNKILPDITNHIGDPLLNKPFSKKGLVIGNIQSGKTSNYLGLICNASDAGYKVIIVLSGTLETLRRQTQQRIEEGFVGYNNSAEEKTFENLRNYRPSDPFPNAATTRDSDFVVGRDQDSYIANINNLSNPPVIYVIKKNVSVLKRLYKYLAGVINNPNEKIKAPLLVIDDEADNASINTNSEESGCDPTKTNAGIRKIISLFEKSTYVGYTATPFANVFILPDSKDKLGREDLFPKDFIYYLNVPKADPTLEFNTAHYIGPEQVFTNNGYYGNNRNDTEHMVVEINDDDQAMFPIKHKRTLEVNKLFPSFFDSIRTFIIANAIRDLRKHKNTHRSMLVNMSAYIDVQKQITQITKDYLVASLVELKNTSNLSIKDAETNATVKEFKESFINHYQGKTEFSWEEIFSCLYSAGKDIKVTLVNSATKDKLKYDDHKEGLRVIAIGGLALSRGLTLYGLMTSYFYRNTQTYDVLMQMGRWFGYRPGYADICRLWITDESCDWYSSICKTINKLWADIFQMNHSVSPSGEPWSPLTYGIRIWTASEQLGLRAKTVRVTANNKMHNVTEQTEKNSYFGDWEETPYFPIDYSLNEKLKNKFNSIFNKTNLSFQPTETPSKQYVYNLPRNLLDQFFDNLESFLPEKDIGFGFNPVAIRQFLQDFKTDESLESFDLAFYGGSSSCCVQISDTDCRIPCLETRFDVKNGLIRAQGPHLRLGSQSDTKVNLQNFTPEIEKNIQRGYREEIYLKYRTKPLLMVYFVKLKPAEIPCGKPGSLQIERDWEYTKQVNEWAKDHYLLGLGIAFQDDGKAHHQERYFVNKGANYFNKDHTKKDDDDSSEEVDEIGK